MKQSIIKTIIGGALLGAVVFFTGPLLLIVLLLKFIFTPFGMGRMMMARRFSPMGMPSFAFAEKIRGMNDDEFNVLKEKIQSRFNGRCHNQNH
jgi:hypothetical protein